MPGNALIYRTVVLAAAIFLFACAGNSVDRPAGERALVGQSHCRHPIGSAATEYDNRRTNDAGPRKRTGDDPKTTTRVYPTINNSQDATPPASTGPPAGRVE